MAEHTPTPWICDSEGILPISRDGVSIVARIPNHPDNKANWDADAAFIVKACNAHDMLVNALEGIRDQRDNENADIDAICNTAERALRAVVGGEKL